MHLSIHTWLVRYEGLVILIDTGIGNGKDRPFSALFHHTPGHSVAHFSIALESGGAEALFTGDVMHDPVQVQRPELGSVFCGDLARARRSREWLLGYAAERDATLFTAHFPEPSAGKVARGAGGFAWTYL